MGDLIFAILWLGAVLAIILLSRMSRYYHREAMYWYMHIRFTDLAMQLGEQHPEYAEGYYKLMEALKVDTDLHQMETKGRSAWDKIKDGGRLPLP